MTSAAVRSLMSGLIDYAGLFPPASLSMQSVSDNYRDYQSSTDAWALGRLILPVARLDEFAESLGPAVARECIPVSALLGADWDDDYHLISNFNRTVAPLAMIDAVEAKATSPLDALRLATLLNGEMQGFVEIPFDGTLPAQLESIARASLHAKVRTGGVTAAAFPTAAGLAAFITQCHARGVRWKATAGLHHPLRAEHRLTYESNAPTGVMFGFLNVVLAAAAARYGADVGVIAQLLDERDISTLVFEEESIGFRDLEFSFEDLRSARERSIASVGSCSFREPIDELTAMRVAHA